MRKLFWNSIDSTCSVLLGGFFFIIEFSPIRLWLFAARRSRMLIKPDSSLGPSVFLVWSSIYFKIKGTAAFYFDCLFDAFSLFFNSCLNSMFSSSGFSGLKMSSISSIPTFLGFESMSSVRFKTLAHSSSASFLILKLRLDPDVAPVVALLFPF